MGKLFGLDTPKNHILRTLLVKIATKQETGQASSQRTQPTLVSLGAYTVLWGPCMRHYK